MELKIPPVLLATIFAALMWLVSSLPPAVQIPFGLRTGALLVFAVAGAFFGLAGVWSFRKANTSVNPLTPQSCSALVDSGVFRVSRNPMYLALLLALLGWALFLANPYSLALAAIFVFYMNRFQILPEEKALEAAFGEAFHDYRSSVRRWL